MAQLLLYFIYRNAPPIVADHPELLLLYFIYMSAPPIVADHPELMKQALQLKPNHENVQLNKRLQHMCNTSTLRCPYPECIKLTRFR
jgi:hypothetical protein